MPVGPSPFRATSGKTRPIQRELGITDGEAAAKLAMDARWRTRQGPELPDVPHASVPQLAGTQLRNELKASSTIPALSSRKLR